MKPHKYADLIKLWADGAEIEQKYTAEDNPQWEDFDGCWDFNFWEYRIKPEDDSILYYATKESITLVTPCNFLPNLKLNFDSETGKLKSAEVLK